MLDAPPACSDHVERYSQDRTNHWGTFEADTPHMELESELGETGGAHGTRMDITYW